jgi:hypothetical protein
MLKFISPMFALMLMSASALAVDFPECKGGAYQVIRLDEIKDGKWDLFVKAVKDHAAWYAANGRPDKIELGRLLEKNAVTGALSYSQKQALTIHSVMEKPEEPKPTDAAWAAFVQEYRDSSEIKKTVVACVGAAE